MAHLQVFHPFADAGVVHLGDDEDAGGHARAYGVVHTTPVGRQHPAVRCGDQHLVQVLFRRRRAVHAGPVGQQARGVGNGGHFHHRLRPVHEFHQHPRVHVPAVRLVGIGVGGGVDVQGVVLALACADDPVAHGRDELDQFHAGRRLVARAQRIDNTQPFGFGPQIGADGHVGLDVHHYQVLAAFHRGKPDLGPDRGHASRVHHHVDQARLEQRFDPGCRGHPSRLDRRVDSVSAVCGLRPVGIAIGDGHRPFRGLRIEFRNRADLDALHLRHARHDVGPHLARTHKADPDRTPGCRALGKVAGEAGQGDVGGHARAPVQARLEYLNVMSQVNTDVHAAVRQNP